MKIRAVIACLLVVIACQAATGSAQIQSGFIDIGTMAEGYTLSVTLTFPIPFSAVPQFTVLPIKWTFKTTQNLTTTPETIQPTVSSLTATGAIVSLLVNTPTDEIHLSWVATNGRYLNLINFALIESDFTDTTGVPTVYRSPFTVALITLAPGTYNLFMATLISGYSRRSSFNAASGGSYSAKTAVGIKIVDGNLVYHLDIPAFSILGLIQMPNLFKFALYATDPIALSFTWFIARKPIAGYPTYSSMAFDSIALSSTVISDASTPLQQITSPAIDKTGLTLMPIIGFAQYNVNDQLTTGDPSPIGASFIDENNYSWTIAASYTGEMQFYFLFYAFPTACPAGCVNCLSTLKCTTCERTSYRIRNPNPLCPCLSGFYADLAGVCNQCPIGRFCKTCAIVDGSTNYGGIDCLGCICSHHREVTDGACLCKTGYHDNTDPDNPYCIRNA